MSTRGSRNICEVRITPAKNGFIVEVDYGSDDPAGLATTEALVAESQKSLLGKIVTILPNLKPYA